MKFTIAVILFLGLLYTFAGPVDAHRGGGGYGGGGRYGGRGWGIGLGGFGLGGFGPGFGYGGYGYGGYGYGGYGYGGYGYGGLGYGGLGYGYGGLYGSGIGWGYPARGILGIGRRAVAESRPRVECNYFNSTSKLVCVSPNKSVECETIGQFEKYASSSFFNFYAIDAVPSGDLSKPENVRFALYPEMLEERGWLNSTFVDPVSKKDTIYSIYSGPQSDNGFRVKDPICFAKIVGLFTGIGFNETIVVGRDSSAFKQVDVLGGVLMGF